MVRVLPRDPVTSRGSPINDNAAKHCSLNFLIVLLENGLAKDCLLTQRQLFVYFPLTTRPRANLQLRHTTCARSCLTLTSALKGQLQAFSIRPTTIYHHHHSSATRDRPPIHFPIPARSRNQYRSRESASNFCRDARVLRQQSAGHQRVTGISVDIHARLRLATPQSSHFPSPYTTNGAAQQDEFLRSIRSRIEL
jgi:hypothetical protein